MAIPDAVMDTPAGRSILLVEDEPLIALAEKKTIERAGYRVTTVNTGEKAVAAMQNGTETDLILMDINLGDGIDGTEAAQIILQNRELPIVFLSSHTEPETVDKTEKISSYGYVVKNSGDTVLLASIRMAFRLHHAYTERKKAEQALQESNSAIKNKLDAIVEQDGDIGELSLEDLVDRETLQSLMDDFYRLTKVGAAIIDVSGNVLVATGWQEICTRFHRLHPEAAEHCRESDVELTQGIHAGTFKAYKCKNNLWDVATPIVVGDQHLGNIFIGQFFYDDEMPDRELFRTQAQAFGFDEAQYLAALEQVPRFSRERVNTAMKFYAELAGLVSSLSYKTIELARTNYQNTVALRERQKAEEALRSNEQQFRGLIENMPLLVNAVNKDGGFTFWNRACEKLTGYSRNEIIGNPNAMTLLYPDPVYREQLVHCWVTAKRQLQHEEIILTAKDGERRHVVWYNTEAGLPLPGGDNWAIGVDVTEQRELQRQLVSRTQYLDTILQTTADGLWVVDLDRKITLANEAYCRMSGYTMDELLQMTVNDIDAEEDPEKTAARIRHIIDNGHETFETRHRRKDGSVFDVEVSATFVNVNGGQFISFYRDISQRKAAEERTQEFLREKETLLKEVQHRIKNNLNTMMSLLALQADSVHDPAAVEALNAAQGRFRSLQVLYDQLYRTESHQSGSVATYLENLVGSVLSLSPDAEEITVDLQTVDCTTDAKWLSSLGMIVNELITNAMKYAFHDQPEPRLTIHGSCHNKRYTLTVADNGPGLPESLDNSTAPGFGMSVVTALTSQLGGSIRFENDHGTRVVLELPVQT